MNLFHTVCSIPFSEPTIQLQKACIICGEIAKGRRYLSRSICQGANVCVCLSACMRASVPFQTGESVWDLGRSWAGMTWCDWTALGSECPSLCRSPALCQSLCSQTHGLLSFSRGMLVISGWKCVCHGRHVTKTEHKHWHTEIGRAHV